MILPDDLRLRLLSGGVALSCLAGLQRPEPAAAALFALVLAHPMLGIALPWRRLWHLEAAVILLLVSLPFTLPGQTLVQIGGWQASLEGAVRALVIGCKVTASALLVSLLLGRVPLLHLAAALRGLFLPAPLVAVLIGAMRQIGTLRAEMARLQEAMRARSFRPGSNRHTWRSYGHMLGMLVLRSLHCATRIEEAQRLRGFAGALALHPLPPPRRADQAAAFALVAMAGLTLWWDRIGGAAG